MGAHKGWAFSVLLALCMSPTAAQWPQQRDGNQHSVPRGVLNDEAMWDYKVIYNSSYDLNLWYRYAKYVARSRNNTNCYVCTHMPIAANNPYVVPKPANTSTIFPHALPSALSPHLMNMSVNWQMPPPVNVSKLDFSQFMGPPHNETSHSPLYGPVHIPPGAKYTCYENHVYINTVDPVQMGEVSRVHCAVVHTPCTPLPNGTLNTTQATPGTTCVPYFQAPDALGVYGQLGFNWLCGSYMFLDLPMGWEGRCAPVEPADHSYMVTLHHLSRAKRNVFEHHDSIWGTDVPNDHKLWTDGQKVVHALFPWVGVGKVELRMETFSFRVGLFMNSTITALSKIRQELTALRLVALQNRLVLDQLTAAQGGVCTLIGATCCTFIPDNDKDAGIIQQAILNLTALRDAAEADNVDKGDFLSWLTSGPWYGLLLKIVTPLVTVLVIIFIVLGCVMPCVHTLIQRTMSQALTNYAHVQYQQLSATTDQYKCGPMQINDVLNHL